jgi:hypothetical protein
MKCIMGAETNCIKNKAGNCLGKPEPDSIPCVGQICWGIKQEGQDGRRKETA